MWIYEYNEIPKHHAVLANEFYKSFLLSDHVSKLEIVQTRYSYSEFKQINFLKFNTDLNLDSFKSFNLIDFYALIIDNPC